ncbi:MAG: Chaperone protein Skp precursor [Pseudomonadota bacterium]|jgi:outer membrane protein
MNKLLKTLLASAVMAALLAPLSGMAQEFKMGIVNTDRIFRESNAARQAQAKLEQEFAKRDKDIIDGSNNLKLATEKFEREAPTLSEAQRNTRQRQLMDQDRELQRKRREFQEDFNARRNEEQQLLLERANRAVKQVAEAEKYDMVLQEAAYVNPRLDITEKVIRMMNGPAAATK